MIDYAHTLTDREINRIQRYLKNIYRKAQEDVSGELQEYEENLNEDAEALLNDIKTAENASDKKKAKLAYQLFYLSLIKKDKQFDEVSNRIVERLYQANKDAAKYINTRTAKIYAVNYNQIGQDIAENHPDYTFSPMTKKEAEQNGEITRQTVVKDTDTTWNKQNIATAIVSGAVLMHGSKKIMKSAAKSVVRKNQASMNRQASDTLTDAENKGRIDSMKAANDEGIVVKKIWVSVGDDRVRDTHVEYSNMNPVDIDYEYNVGLRRPRDPDCSIMSEICNCRCCIKVD